MSSASLLERRFPALLSPDFRRLWVGQIISAAGSQMQFAALNWQVYEMTRDPAKLGAIGLVRVVPIILFSLLGGTVADAHDRRKLLLITQTALTLVAVALGVLALLNRTTLFAIYALTALGAAAVAFDNPARQALIPALVPREHLPNAFALNSTGFQVATVAGPVLAGLTLRHLGAGWAYLANAASFVAVIAALLLLRYRPAPEEQSAGAPRVSWESLKEGIAFVRNTPILVSTMGLDFLATFFSSASALLPIFAKDLLNVGPEGYGLLAAFPAVGSLAAGSLMSLLPPVKEQGRVLVWSVLAYGVATVAFGFSPLAGAGAAGFALAAACLAATGASDTVSTVLRQTIRQTVTPDRLRGRMVAVNMIFFMGGPQLGELEAGLVAKWAGAVASVVSGGVACLLCTAAVAARSPWLLRYRLVKGEEEGTAAAR
jgi:MFS family permease